MAKMWCKCDERMSNTLCPNDIVYWVYSDVTMDKICENDTIPTISLAPNCDGLLCKNDYVVWRCPKCKRLYVYEKNAKYDTPPKYIYQLENE